MDCEEPRGLNDSQRHLGRTWVMTRKLNGKRSMCLLKRDHQGQYAFSQESCEGFQGDLLIQCIFTSLHLFSWLDLSWITKSLSRQHVGHSFSYSLLKQRVEGRRTWPALSLGGYWQKRKDYTDFFCDNMAFLVLSVAICLFGTTYDICDTQENERRLDDNMKWMKLFHRNVNFGMRLASGFGDC